MARLEYSVDSGIVTWAATAKTFATITAPANQRVVLKGLTATGQGTTNTDTPLQIELLAATSISGGTPGTVVTSKKADDLSETIQSTVAGNYSVEPTYTGPVVKKTLTCHPQLGLAIFWPLGSEYVIKGGTVLGIRITSPQADKMALSAELEE